MYTVKNYPKEIKVENIMAILKKKTPLEKTNYRPISILPTVSNIFEKMLFNQLQRFSNKFLSSLLCGIRKGCNAQHAL